MCLLLDMSDVNFLQSILPCLASSLSLQELDVRCDASGVFSRCATHTCICTVTQTARAWTYHTYHMPTKWACACSFNQLTPITHATYCILVCLSSIAIFIYTSSPAHTHTHMYSTFTNITSLIRILFILRGSTCQGAAWTLICLGWLLSSCVCTCGSYEILIALLQLQVLVML